MVAAPVFKQSPDANRWYGPDNLFCLSALVFLIFLLCFGSYFHYIELCYSSEYDRYVEKADVLQAGSIPRDPYHPLLYPILIAGLARITGDTFAAARTISTLACAAVLLCTYFLWKQCRGPVVGWLCAGLLVINGTFLLEGMLTTTDMLFSAMAMIALLCAITVSRSAKLWPSLALGATLGAAFFTRYSALALMPSAVLAVWLAPLEGTGRRLARLLWVAAVALAVLIPHFVLTTRMFGSPLYNENVNNVARKALNIDYERIKQKAPFSGVGSLILHEPGAVFSATLSTANAWINEGILAYVAGNRQFVSAAVIFAGFLAGLFMMIRQRDGTDIIILTYLVAYFAMICISVEPFPRLLLPVLPLCLGIAIAFMVRALDGEVDVFGWQIPACALPMAVLWIITGSGLSATFSDAARMHPLPELQASKLLERQAGHSIVVMGSFPFMQRYVGYKYIHLDDDALLAESGDKVRYFTELIRKVSANKADFLIFGSASLGPRPAEVLTGRGMPRELIPWSIRDGVAVYKVHKDS